MYKCKRYTDIIYKCMLLIKQHFSHGQKITMQLISQSGLFDAKTQKKMKLEWTRK